MAISIGLGGSGGIGAQVSKLMRTVAAEVVLPRYQHLRAGEIAEKSPGEVVTCVDLEAELRLSAGLADLLPSALLVGEEAVAADPSLLDKVGEGVVWLIDPLDGTRNYSEGRAPFGMMVALVVDGEPQMGWMLDPLTDRMCFAERGQGAYCDDARVTTDSTPRDRPIAALGTHFLSPRRREEVHAAASRHFERVAVPMCAAESYPRLVLGRDDIMLFQRSLPWDHAAGALFVTEAGGRISHWDLSDYRVGGPSSGILAASDAGLWERAAEVLIVPAAGYSAAVERAA